MYLQYVIQKLVIIVKYSLLLPVSLSTFAGRPVGLQERGVTNKFKNTKSHRHL